MSIVPSLMYRNTVVAASGGGGNFDPYSTTFAVTENPISEGSIWTNGLATGGSWNNVRCDPTNGAYATAASPSDYSDNIATIQGRFTANKHFAQIKCNRPDGAYTPPSTSLEIECLVGFTIASGNAKGYEFDVIYDGTILLARWNGAQGDFTTSGFTTLSGSIPTLAHNDVLKVVYDATSGSPVMTVFKNSTQVWQVTDTQTGKITSGSPGIGFFSRSSSDTFTKHTISAFSAGSA